MPVLRRAIFTLVVSQLGIPSQPAPQLNYAAIKPALDAVYATHAYPVVEALDRRAAAEIQRAIEPSGDRSDETAVVLLQIIGAERLYPNLKPEVVRRGLRMLPHLVKYRDLPFPTPIGEYKYGIHLPPYMRREVYDEVIASIQNRPYYGLSPDVERLLLPFLDRYTKVVDNEATYRNFDRLLASRDAAGDEAIAVLLDYRFEASFRLGLDGEIYDRGKRMIPLLRRRISDFSVTLSRRYPRRFVDERRNEKIETMIQAIELGEAEQRP